MSIHLLFIYYILANDLIKFDSSALRDFIETSAKLRVIVLAV